jgi:alkylated DNA nucleotide flippase Atl1
MIEVVKRIPRGYVTNYGTIATIVQEELDRRVTPRVIGRQLSGLPEYQRGLLPWRRVIAKSGAISTLKLGDK